MVEAVYCLFDIMVHVADCDFGVVYWHFDNSGIVFRADALLCLQKQENNC